MDNDALIAALLADRERYTSETPAVPQPDAIVVSGDLVQGAPLGQGNWQETLKEQYRVAGGFLDGLARRLLDGDRSRIVILPGNHDVCWNTSLASMERVPEADYPADIRGALVKADTEYRWNWRERALYRIHDPETYAKRLDFYWDFVERFYADVALRRPINRTAEYQLFELHERRVIVAAFNSTLGNDCFAYSGAIPRGAVARCDLELRDLGHTYALRIAAWHHSLQGPPMREDYMDASQILEMTGLGFQLGLHGHQHVAAATTYYVHLWEAQPMAVVSAGSLCSGSQELPRGVNRQYNLIVVDEDYRSARVHVREMTEGEQFARKNSGAFASGFVELRWQPNRDSVGRAIDANAENERRAILAAEGSLRAKDPERALRLLGEIDLSTATHARKIAVQAAVEVKDQERLISILDPPQSVEEAVILIMAFIHVGDFDRASTLLDERKDIDPATASDLGDQIKTRREMRR